MKKCVAVLSMFMAVVFGLISEEIVLEDWSKGTEGWDVSLAKGPAPDGTMTYMESRKCVEILLPSELVFVKKSDITTKGVTKISFELTPMEDDFGWLEVGIVFQSTVEKWKVLGLQQAKKNTSAQVFEFEIDGDLNSDSEWNKMWIRLNTHKNLRVRLGRIVLKKG